MMRSPSALMLVVLAVFGCARSGGPPLDLDPAELTPQERTAVELAVKHSHDHGLKWGKPTAIEPLGIGWERELGGGADCFRVAFPTPKREVPLLGDRELLVNATTGKVLIAPRD